MPSGTYDINDHLVLVGSKSLRIVASASPFSIMNTTNWGNLSAYTGQNSGHPTTGTIGLWVYLQAGEITTITLTIGSSASNCVDVAGVKTYTDSFDTQDGWNYFVFRLKDHTNVVGTPDWTATDYTKIAFTSSTTPTCVIDYLTIGTGDEIGLNGLGERVTDYTTTTTTY